MEYSDQDLENLTDEEILELERLLLEEGLYILDEDTNPNYRLLHKCITSQEWDEDDKLKPGSFIGAMLEGSSRSGKTWSGVDIIIWLCLIHDPGCKITIYREYFADFRDTLYDDFKRRLDDFGLPNPFDRAETVKSFKINGSRISFKGCDRLGSKHGAGADYVFFNEVMTIPEPVYKQATMRCRRFYWGDYNPSVTEHWVFNNVLNRPEIAFLRTTYKDNIHLGANERLDIEITEPYEPGSYYVEDSTIMYKGKPVDEKNQPPPHPTNILNGTADAYHWKVYGLGLRGAMKGRVFNYVTYQEERPTDLDYSYGLDFGFTTDPTVLTRNWEDERTIYIEYLSYAPMETAEEIDEYMASIGIEKDKPITADSSDRYTSENKGAIRMVSSLDALGWEISKVKKTESVMYWLNTMKKKKIVIIKNEFYRYAKKEFENYRLKEIHGIAINQPIDKDNHGIDSARYRHMAFNAPVETWSMEGDARDYGINH